MNLFKKKKRSPIDGVVISVRVGDRCRVAVQSDTSDTVHYLLCSRPTKKVGDKVRAGQVVGVI